MRFLLSIFLILSSSVFLLTNADVYVHHPRGSNNRNNEQTATRSNNNRLFDSQNNARGGYNVGDKTAKAFSADNNPTDPAIIYDYNRITDADAAQYPFLYYEGSILPIEWTNQHGCGGSEKNDPHQQNCEIIMQYMCETKPYSGTGIKYEQIINIHDGTTTDTPQEIQNNGDAAPTDNAARRGRHESEQYYYECKKRSRNKGLFTADQQLRGDRAINTRQNPNGGRSGLECPEERDYYPYWSPSPWKDIVIITDHPEEKCTDYQQLSQNIATVYKCEKDPSKPASTDESKNYMNAITQNNCLLNGGIWTPYSNSVGKAPECLSGANYWSRTNHLGNGRGGEALRYQWKLPTIAELSAHNVNINNGFAKCVFRLRYNISTDDYDIFNTTSSKNKKERSPVTNNPTIDVGGPTPLKLAVNTAQFGRTFQDRSHIFYIKSRPTEIPANRNILNLSVRGKRGNIVQTYPAVEYDFIPNKLTVYDDELIHVQWTGSNTHNNGGGGGDGQAGDAGEGTGGTDRHNMVQLMYDNENYPLPLDKFPDNMWSNMQCSQIQQGTTIQSYTNWVDCALTMATSGYMRSSTAIKNDFNNLLNNAPPSLVGGILFDFNTVDEDTTYYYMCSRNNNFSNRSQKGAITIKPGKRPA